MSGQVCGFGLKIINILVQMNNIPYRYFDLLLTGNILYHKLPIWQLLEQSKSQACFWTALLSVTFD